MKPIVQMLRAALLALAAIITISAEASDSSNDTLAKARAQYPLHSCIVSGEHLNAGEIVDYVYQESGKPDRLVRLCCRKCVTRFKADPARFLKKLDETSAEAEKKSNPADAEKAR